MTRPLTEKEISLFLGREFKHGVVDCYALIKDFYQVAFGISLSNYARPDDWWHSGLNLYADNVLKEGFKLMDMPLRDLQYGDFILMAIKSTVPCHAAIYIGDGKILHHFYGRQSNIELLKGIWHNSITGIYRHKDVKIDLDLQTVELIDDPRIKSQLILLEQKYGEGWYNNLKRNSGSSESGS